jgi:hypothetical protein
MPHVVITGPIDLARIYRELPAFEERRGGALLKLRDALLSRSGRTLLLDAVVVEGLTRAANSEDAPRAGPGATRRFLVEVDQHRDGLTVRLYPPTDPEKTAGVKRLVARVASHILSLDERARVVRTNLAAELAECPAEVGKEEPA